MVAMTDDADGLLTTEEAAERLGITADRMAQWRSRGQGPAYIKHKGFVRYRASDLTAWLDANRVDPTASAEG